MPIHKGQQAGSACAAVGSKDFCLPFSSGVSWVVGAVLISILDAKR